MNTASRLTKSSNTGNKIQTLYLGREKLKYMNKIVSYIQTKLAAKYIFVLEKMKKSTNEIVKISCLLLTSGPVVAVGVDCRKQHKIIVKNTGSTGMCTNGKRHS